MEEKEAEEEGVVRDGRCRRFAVSDVHNKRLKCETYVRRVGGKVRSIPPLPGCWRDKCNGRPHCAPHAAGPDSTR